MSYYLIEYNDILEDESIIELWKEEPVGYMSYKSKNGWELAHCICIDQVISILEARILTEGTEAECERYKIGLELLK